MASNSSSYQITELLNNSGWKWPLDVSSPTNLPLKVISTMRSDQVTHDFIKSGTGNLQGWRWQNSSGQPVPMMDSPHGEKVFPYNQSETLLFQFESIVSHPLVTQHCEEPVFLDNLLIDIVRLLLGLPEDTKERIFFFPPGWTRAVPSVSIYSVNATASSAYWWPAVKLAPIYRCLTFTEDPKLAVVF